MDFDHEEDKAQFAKEEELRTYSSANAKTPSKVGDVKDLADAPANGIMKKNEFFDQFDKLVPISIAQERNKSILFL
jgi:hypothetical protein